MVSPVVQVLCKVTQKTYISELLYEKLPQRTKIWIIKKENINISENLKWHLAGYYLGFSNF